MSECYLTAFIDKASRTVDRVTIASAYPVAQRGFDRFQALLVHVRGATYDEASHKMRRALNEDRDLAWVRPLLHQGGARG